MNNTNTNTCTVKTKIGNFSVEIKKNKVTKIFPTNLNNSSVLNLPIFKLVKKEINNFLEGKITNFSFPILLLGTSFQKKVWKEIKKIKYGKTLSYLDIANKIKSSPRAVGRACSKNKYLFIIPCHRVICSNGNIGEYIMGKKIKNYLLRMEKN